MLMLRLQKFRIAAFLFKNLAIAVFLLSVSCHPLSILQAQNASSRASEASQVSSVAFEQNSISKGLPDRFFNALFTRYEDGWTGGDGTYSVGLPDGRTVWMFGDTFLGRVYPDRSRPKDSPLIHNCFLIQDNTSLITLHGGTPERPAALVTPQNSSSWYWPGDGTVENNLLRVFMRKFTRTGQGIWDWIWIGTDIGTFSLPQLKLQSLKPAVSENQILYGSAIFEDEDYVYIYGTEDLKTHKYAHVARTSRNHLLGQWKFFTNKGWTVDPMSSKRILEGVANQFSVLKAGHHYYLITMNNRIAFDNKIFAYISHSPFGPWSKPILLYITPEARDDVVTYNALAHPQFYQDGKLLISYNVNHIKSFTAIINNADLYRPKFIRVDMLRIKESE